MRDLSTVVCFGHDLRVECDVIKSRLSEVTQCLHAHYWAWL